MTVINPSLDTNYYNLVTNTQDLEKTRLILIGETHVNPRHRTKNVEIIARLAERHNKSLILVEDYRDSLSADQLFGFAPLKQSAIDIKGWDIEIKQEISPKELESKVNSLVKKYIAIIVGIGLGVTFFNSRWIQAAIILSGVVLLVLSVASAVVDPQQLMRNVALRNKHMFKIIEENKNKYDAIFVLAGSVHFDKTSEFLNKNKVNNDEAISDLNDFLKNKQFAILIPK